MSWIFGVWLEFCRYWRSVRTFSTGMTPNLEHRIDRNGTQLLACRAASFAPDSCAAHIGGQVLTSEGKIRSCRESFTNNWEET
jgi:hypothetical protein